jgi:hypothetical protein
MLPAESGKVTYPRDDGATSWSKSCVFSNVSPERMAAWTVTPFVRVDALVVFLAVEVRDEFDDTGNTGGATDQDDLSHVGLVDLRVPQDLRHRLEGAAEEILTELFESGMGQGTVEVDAWVAEERVRLARSQASCIVRGFEDRSNKVINHGCGTPQKK